MVTESNAEAEGPHGRCAQHTVCQVVKQKQKQQVAPVLEFSASRPKYDDLLSNPTTEAQTVGHTRVAAVYKAKVCLEGLTHVFSSNS